MGEAISRAPPSMQGTATWALRSLRACDDHPSSHEAAAAPAKGTAASSTAVTSGAALASAAPGCMLRLRRSDMTRGVQKRSANSAQSLNAVAAVSRQRVPEVAATRTPDRTCLVDGGLRARHGVTASCMRCGAVSPLQRMDQATVQDNHGPQTVHGTVVDGNKDLATVPLIATSLLLRSPDALWLPLGTARWNLKRRPRREPTGGLPHSSAYMPCMQ